MANNIIVPEIFGNAVNDKLGVSLKAAALAFNATPLVSEILNQGDRINLPLLNRVAVSNVVTGVPVTPANVDMTDRQAVIKQVESSIRVYDTEAIQVKSGGLVNEMVVQVADALAKAVDTDLIKSMDDEAIFVTPTATPHAITSDELLAGMEVFGDDRDTDSYAGILLSPRVLTSLLKMPEFINISISFNTGNGKQNGIVTNGLTVNKPHNLPTVASPWFGRGLSMYHLPIFGEKYFIGVDCAEGLSQDYSAIEIINSEGVQCCEFKSNTIKPFQFAEVVNDLAAFYNRGYLVIEKASSGHTIIDKLKNEYHYQNMHKHKEYDQRGNTVRKAGFIMNGKTKPMIIDNFVELLATNQILINSKDLLSEMKLFQYENGSMNASRGYHDDLVISFALALHGMANGVNYA